MSGTNSSTITASTAVMASRARSVLSRISSIERHFQNIETAVSRSSSYWIGEAGKTHRKVYSEAEDGMDEVLAGFKDTASALEKIAAEYDTTETATVAKAAGLPTNILV